MNYYENNLKLGEKWLYLIGMLNEIQTPKETVVKMLRLWTIEKKKSVEKRYALKIMTDLEFKDAQDAIYMACMEALWFIDKIVWNE